MGSLNTKTKWPDPVVYTSAPVTNSPAETKTPAASVPEDAGTDDTAKAADVARRHSLPQTILTSFRGVLSPGEWVPQRKSLLGE